MRVGIGPGWLHVLIWWAERGVLGFIFLTGEVGLGWSSLDGLDGVKECGREVMLASYL